MSKNQALQQFLSNKDDFVPRSYAGADLEVVRLDKDDKRLCAQVFDVACESFSDDRFHLDPKCAKQTADQRFVYWVRDLLANPEVIFYIVRHKEDIAGFMAWNGEHP
ncbi:MAG: hypothetical protein ACUVQV_09065 [Dissulfurimicrobium sp.]|uniref:hypothetical protein n=1 Tax=Dissulfurimicrobium sp. TaxID=2022436 RepID=UPI004049A073